LKNIFITGCGSGLGKTLLEYSKNYDCKVFAHYKSSQNDFSGDITQKDFLNKLPNILFENDIDVFINNAGIYTNDFLVNTPDEQIENIITTNLTSQILITKRVVKYFKTKKTGLILNVNSLAGKIPSAKESIYCASKSGLYSFSKSLQLELLYDNIHIVDLFPGAMKTKMTEYRNNYESLIETKDISEIIFDIIFKHKNIHVNELVIRRKY